MKTELLLHNSNYSVPEQCHANFAGSGTYTAENPLKDCDKCKRCADCKKYSQILRKPNDIKCNCASGSCVVHGDFAEYSFTFPCHCWCLRHQRTTKLILKILNRLKSKNPLFVFSIFSLFLYPNLCPKTSKFGALVNDPTNNYISGFVQRSFMLHTYFVSKLRLCVCDVVPILYSKQLIQIRKLLLLVISNITEHLNSLLLICISLQQRVKMNSIQLLFAFALTVIPGALSVQALGTVSFTSTHVNTR